MGDVGDEEVEEELVCARAWSVKWRCMGSGVEQVWSHLLNIVEQSSSLLDRRDDRGKVVISQYHISRLLGDITSVHAHGDADVRLLERGGVIHAVASHDAERTAAVHGLDHAHLCRRAAPGEDQRQPVHGVDLRVAQGVERAGLHDGLRVDRRTRRRGRKNADLPRDRRRRLHVVASEHVHRDARPLALEHRRRALHAWGVVQAYQADEVEPRLGHLALRQLRRGCGPLGYAEHAEALGGERVGHGGDLALLGIGDLEKGQDRLYGALGVRGQEALGVPGVVDNCHSLAGRIERELGGQGRLLVGQQIWLAHAEAHGKHLQGDLSGLAQGGPRLSLRDRSVVAECDCFQELF